MPDIPDVVPAAMDQKGNTVIWWVETIADLKAPKASTEIGATSSTRVTHSFTTDGWTLTGSQATSPDERLALESPLESLDTLTQSFGSGMKYVNSTDPKSAAVVLKPTAPARSKSGYFVVREGISNGVVAAASQPVQVIPVTVGPQIRGAITGSGKSTFTQQAAISGPIVEGVLAA